MSVRIMQARIYTSGITRNPNPSHDSNHELNPYHDLSASPLAMCRPSWYELVWVRIGVVRGVRSSGHLLQPIFAAELSDDLPTR